MASQAFDKLQDTRASMAQQRDIIARAEASIEPVVAPARSELARLQEEASELAPALLREVGLKGLSDPLQALEVYRAGWANGHGSLGFEDALRELLRETYLRPSWDWVEVAEGDHDYLVPALQLAIPVGLDEERVERTLEALEGVYRAQVELVETMRVRVDNGSEYMTLLELSYESASGLFKLWDGYVAVAEGTARSVVEYMTSRTRYLDSKSNIVRDEDEDF